MTNQLIEARNNFTARNPEQRALLNGRDWGFWDVGTGPVLLLIPGTLGRGDVFWQQIEALSDRLRIIAISYPDSGGITDWSADLNSLLTQLGVDQLSLLGSSLGGYLAQYFASEYPERVTKLFAANTLNTVIGREQKLPYSLDLANTDMANIRAGFNAGLGAWAETHPDQADLVELLLGEANGRILEGELRARLSALKFGPELNENHNDVVTIETKDDPLIQEDMRDAVRARLNPKTSYRFLWGGHFPYVVRPNEYISLLEENMGLDVTGPSWGEGAMREQ